MNKLIILFLAVCLVSVHAFVKREATETAQPDFDFEKTKNDIVKTLTDNAKLWKEGFDTVVGKISEAMTDLKPKDAPKA